MVTFSEQEFGTLKTALEIAVGVFRRNASQAMPERAGYWQSKTQAANALITKLSAVGIE